MNEEEKKAFKELSKKAVLCNYEERDYPNMICFKKDMLIVLNLLEKQQKENEELKTEIERMKSLDIYKLVEDCETGQLISIQKIKDKIEKLKRQKDGSLLSVYNVEIEYCIQVLQELLEEGDNK